MNYSVFRFTLNMHNHRSQVAIPVFLGDTGIRLLISITDGGTPYFIEDGCTAYIRGKKADGKGLFNQCLILNNTTIQYDFTKQTSNCEGITTCEIELYGKDGTLITAPKFIIVVDSRSLSDSEIAAIIEESDAEVSIIPEIIEVLEAEEVRKANELERQAKETERQANEVNRIALYEGVSTSVANLDTRISENDVRISDNDRRITNLENKALSFKTDSSVAYIKDVPENALPYAAISKVGGMSRKSRNIFKVDGIDLSKEIDNGYLHGRKIVATYKENTQYTFSWISTWLSGSTTAQLLYLKIRYTDGTEVTWTNTVATPTDNKTRRSKVTEVGKTVAEISFVYSASAIFLFEEASLVEGTSVMSPYEPYFEGLRDAKVTEVKSSIDTLAIPEAVQSLEGYGQSNPDNIEEYNYIDLVSGKFSSCGHIVDGEWVAYESAQETDISDLITDNFISVERGGTLTFENEYGYNVPSEVLYQLEGVAV